MRRIKLLIEYDGSDYVGWQKQKNGKSIQEEIENCLEKIFSEGITLYVSGRTDAGVHALGQVAHFDISSTKIKISKLNLAINSFLKKNNNKITILESSEVEKSFHARFSVKKKTYLYKILNRKTDSYLLKNKLWFIPVKLNTDKMKKSAKFLEGKHDFSAFRSANCQAQETIRSIEKIIIKKQRDFVDLKVHGRSFMHNQVRIIVGTLINVGKGKWDEKRIKEILKSQDRKKAGPTAPPHGLYLEKISY